jgi:hypothetical protein
MFGMMRMRSAIWQKNLSDFIFRMLLTDMSNQDIYNEIPDEEFRNDIEAVFKSHKNI